MKKIILLVIIAVAFAAGLIVGSKKAGYENPLETPSVTSVEKCGFKIVSPKANERVVFPLQIKGEIDNSKSAQIGCSWTLFEAQAGVAEIYQETKSGWTKVSNPTPIPVPDWMTLTTSFDFQLISPIKLDSGSKIKIVFTEEDPSGMGNAEVIELPLQIK